MHQIPDMFVGFDFSKRGHSAQPNSIFYNPEQFAISVLLHFGRREICCARIHPPAGISWRSAPGAMTRCAVDTVEFVSFFDTRLQIRWWWRNIILVAAPTNQNVFCPCRKKGFELAGFLNGVDLYLSESQNQHDGTQDENSKYNENPEPHPIDSP